MVDVGHHEAHAAMFFVSPFEDATIVVMDGYGDDAATGAPLGSALYHQHHTLGRPRRARLTHAAHGAAYTDREIVAALEAAGIEAEPMDEDGLIDRRGSAGRWRGGSRPRSTSTGPRASRP